MMQASLTYWIVCVCSFCNSPSFWYKNATVLPLFTTHYPSSSICCVGVGAFFSLPSYYTVLSVGHNAYETAVWQGSNQGFKYLHFINWAPFRLWSRTIFGKIVCSHSSLKEPFWYSFNLSPSLCIGRALAEADIRAQCSQQSSHWAESKQFNLRTPLLAWKEKNNFAVLNCACLVSFLQGNHFHCHTRPTRPTHKLLTCVT